jgi:hypothetical protein
LDPATLIPQKVKQRASAGSLPQRPQRRVVVVASLVAAHSHLRASKKLAQVGRVVKDDAVTVDPHNNVVRG